MSHEDVSCLKIHLYKSELDTEQFFDNSLSSSSQLSTLQFVAQTIYQRL